MTKPIPEGYRRDHLSGGRFPPCPASPAGLGAHHRYLACPRLGELGGVGTGQFPGLGCLRQEGLTMEVEI
ncbi:MAG: hypothetical protein HYZ73_04080 [Elusimicrobia bacterium]|nr:hypothetical protein [Elusimicrobiota bacterium]